MEATDRHLIERIRAGDARAFAPLVERYRRRVYQLCCSVVRNEEEALELTQETFLKAWRNLAGFKGDSSFFTWLYRIALNLCLDHTGRASARAEHVEWREDDDSADGSGSPFLAPDRSFEVLDRARRVRAALEKLSPAHRAVIVLREVEGMSYDEIAETMQCSVGTVMSRLFYARRRLAALLTDIVPPETP